jgi:hypothetical protein
MTAITLSDYLGFLYTEVIKARELADSYSKIVAERYAEDPVLSYFSVPRFKIPEINLSIPVVMAGAKFANAYRFILDETQLRKLVTGKVENIIKQINVGKNNNNILVIKDLKVIRKLEKVDVKIKSLAEETESYKLTSEFHAMLTEDFGEESRDSGVDIFWAKILFASLTETKYLEKYKEFDPKGEIFEKSKVDLKKVIAANTVVDKIKIENLLVNPQTNIVKDETDVNSVFIINAKIIEEGVYIKTVRENGKDIKIVDFD